MVRVQSLSDCRVNFDGSELVSVNVLEHVVEGFALLGTVLQLCRFSSPRAVEDCATTFRNGSDAEKPVMFLAIFWLENYEPESQWAMEDSPKEWDPKVTELLDRLFR